MSGERRFAPSARAAATWMPLASTIAMEQRRFMLRIFPTQTWSRCRLSSSVSGAAMSHSPRARWLPGPCPRESSGWAVGRSYRHRSWWAWAAHSREYPPGPRASTRPARPRPAFAARWAPDYRGTPSACACRRALPDRWGEYLALPSRLSSSTRPGAWADPIPTVVTPDGITLSARWYQVAEFPGGRPVLAEAQPVGVAAGPAGALAPPVSGAAAWPFARVGSADTAPVVAGALAAAAAAASAGAALPSAGAASAAGALVPS